MNSRGFTLIELIMAISILAMIALLSTPSIVRLIQKNDVDNYNSTIDSIEASAELYASNNRYKLNFVDEFGRSTFCMPSDTKNIYATITLKTLIDSKDISSPVTNFCTDQDISSETKIKIILSCKTRQFSYDIDENTSENTLKRRINDDGNSIFGIEGIKIEEGDYCDSLY